MGKYFGTDGIRGRFNVELTPAMAFQVGQSLKNILSTETLVIGMDTRESSSELLFAAIAGAQSMGVNVINAGVVSTPLISYYSKQKQVDGIMITASHNPYHDNGIKVFHNGTKLTEKQELEVEAFMDSHREFDVLTVGKVFSGLDVVTLYRELIQDLELDHVPFKLGVDSANGANSQLVKQFLAPRCNTFMHIGDTPNGKNINQNCGSTHPEKVSELVVNNHLDLGLTFDGDGDRIIVVDHLGNVIDGDILIYIVASYLKQHNLLNHDTVVLTKMSNLGVIKALKEKGINTVLTGVGDKYVKEEIERHNYSLGGENSGHIILENFIGTGDGLFVGLFLLKILKEANRTVHEMAKEVTMWPQVLYNIRTFNKEILNDSRVKTVVEQVTNELGSNGKVLVRASGTEPLIRVTISCETQELVDRYMNQIVSIIEDVKGEI